MDNLQDYIIAELRQYRMNLAVLDGLVDDDILGCKAQHLSDVPASVTNKFHSVTESQALNHHEHDELKKDIKRVQRWLFILNDDERHVVEGLFIYNRSYNIIANQWRIYYSRNSWANRKRTAMKKIIELINNTQSHR